MQEKGIEFMVIVILLMVVGILLFPICKKMVYNAQDSSASTSVYNMIDSVKNLYLVENQQLDNKVYLPFAVEYNEESYKTYCNGNEVDLPTKLKLEGNKPTSGTIVWRKDNSIVVNDLVYNNHTCNKLPEGDVECVRNSK